MNTLVHRVVAVLEEASFKSLSKPLVVAGTEFNFDAAVQGTGHSHDLILVATDEIPSQRLQRLVAGLARTLDMATSRRPMTLVFIGDLAPNDRIELERYARVLPLDINTRKTDEIEQAVAVLLPLRLPTDTLTHTVDPIVDVFAALGSKTTEEHIAFVRAAETGVETVREELRRFTNSGAGWSDDEEIENG